MSSQREAEIDLWNSSDTLKMKLREFAVRYVDSRTEQSPSPAIFVLNDMTEAIATLISQHSKERAIEELNTRWNIEIPINHSSEYQDGFIFATKQFEAIIDDRIAELERSSDE